MLEFLPTVIKNALTHVNMHKVYELRLRADKPVSLNYDGVYRFLSKNGLIDYFDRAILCSSEDIAETVYRAGDYSVYAVEEQIKRGYITAKHGERIGLAGTYVYDKNMPLSVHTFRSLCIRVPHEIVGCGQVVYDSCMRDIVRSVLICSPPGLGKTTILRDLSRILCLKTKKNILICDERGEIAEGEVGLSADVLRFADKKTAFEAGIRAMRPDIIITDELTEEDISTVKKAIRAGITVIASAHFYKMETVSESFKGVFDRCVFLNKERIGEITNIFDGEGREIAYG